MSSHPQTSTDSDQQQAAKSAEIDQATHAASAPVWVDHADALQQAATRWQTQEWLALDTEFIRERTFYAQLGLIQISDGISVWLLDVPALCGHDDPIRDLLTNSKINKIIHSCSEDLEVLSQQYQVQPAAVFDSQLAAAMTGRPLQMRYENLVQELLAVELPSGPSRSNWLQRPLSAAQLQYASNDVAYLPLLMRLLVSELKQRQRWSWLQQDMQALLDKASTAIDPDLLYRKIKGFMRCDQAQLSCLQQLAAWRDQQARSRDLPRSFVLRDSGMLELAEVAAGAGTDLAAFNTGLNRLGEIPQRIVQRHRQDWLTLFATRPEQQPALETPLSQQEKARLAGMLEVIRASAKAEQVDPALLASRRVMTEALLELRQSAAPAVQLPGWRGELLNAELAACRA
jgi:ribonuclease D